MLWQVDSKGVCHLLLWTTLIYVQLNAVSCDDIAIVDKVTNQIIFRTASDFVRTSECGSFFQNEAYFVISDPPYTCNELISRPPASSLDQLYSILKTPIVELTYALFRINLNEYLGEDRHWVLITHAEEDGTCDLETKLNNIAKAGYSAVLLATSGKMNKKTLDFNLRLTAKRKARIFLDIHLINPWDVRVFSQYAYSSGESNNNKNSSGKNIFRFTILGPSTVESETCKDFYHETLTTKLFMELSFRKGYNFISSLLLFILAALMVLSPVIFLIYFNEISGIFFPKISLPYEEYYRRTHGPRSMPNAEYRPQYDWNSDSNWEPEPPPGNPASSRGQISRSILKKAELLDLKITTIEELTTSRVKKAFHEKARMEHPDKHNHLHGVAMDKQHEKFTEIKRAYEDLLKDCVDAKPTAEE